MTIYSTYEYNIRTIVICISAQIAKFNFVSNPMNIYYIYYLSIQFPQLTRGSGNPNTVQ